MKKSPVFNRNQKEAALASNLKSPFVWKMMAFTGLVLGLIGFGLATFNTTTKDKIAFVKTNEILEKYEGMVDARAQFEVKMNAWKANVDTLAKEYEADLAAYELERDDLDRKSQLKKETQLAKMRERFQSYSDALQKQAADEDMKGTEAVLTQVNDFLDKYGEEKGFAMIYGANGQGNILFAGEAFDITEEVLEAMNGNYQGSLALK